MKKFYILIREYSHLKNGDYCDHFYELIVEGWDEARNYVAKNVDKYGLKLLRIVEVASEDDVGLAIYPPIISQGGLTDEDIDFHNYGRGQNGQ